MLVDLPGYGFAQRSHAERAGWAKLIEYYLLERPTLRVVVLLVDARRDIQIDDLQLIEVLQAPSMMGRPRTRICVVATKIDQVPASKRAARLGLLRQQTTHAVFGLSAFEHESVAGFWRQLHDKWLELGPPAEHQT